METNLILVDENDKIIGMAEKLYTHKNGLLHRAFSIIILNSKNEILLQKRALNKYHSGGLWTNACCSHPRLGQVLEDAAHQRLVDEMGFDCKLEKKFEFIYKVWFENDQIFEHEYDHVFVGRYDGNVFLNPKEAEEIKWIKLPELAIDLKTNPKNYTYWFNIIMNKLSWQDLKVNPG